MSALSEKLKKLAELNFCEDCYSKYLVLIHGEIEYLLSEPISDWRQTEENINVLWIKAKGLYDTKSPIFSPYENAFPKARGENLGKKLNFLKEKGILHDYAYEYLNQVRMRRNKIHQSSKFSKQDYLLFREAQALTDLMIPPIIFDLKDPIWKGQLDYIEKHAKRLLEKVF